VCIRATTEGIDYEETFSHVARYTSIRTIIALAAKMKWKLQDLGLMHYFLGLEVWQSPERIFLNQGKYTVEILKRFDMLECKPMNTPMEVNLKLLVDTS
jgi:hypothetical protein